MINFNTLSIIIPVGPGDNAWYQLLNDLEIFGKGVEIIISACQLQAVHNELPDNVQWIQSTRGRAHQLNAGVKQASGKLIWLLHADTQLTGDVYKVIQRTIESGDQSVGFFKLKFAGDGPRQTQLNAWAANIRSRFFGLPFGDQGFIMNKKLFDQLNGFDETIGLGEDLDFVVRLQAANIPIQELPAELITSARRYRQNGWLSTTIRHLWFTWCLTRQAKRRLAFSE